MSPSALHSTNPPALPPFLRVKIATMERNRKDLLVRFDASVRRSSTAGLSCRKESLPATVAAS
jgi:hypothetical protein